MQLTVNDKGKVILPQELLEHPGVRPRDKLKLKLEILPQGRIRIAAHRPKGMALGA